MGILLAVPVVSILALSLFLGFGLRDLRALGRYLVHRKAPAATGWQAPEPEGDLVDFAVTGESRILALREGGLWEVDGGALRPLEASQGLLHLFPDGDGGRIWVAGTYHRVMVWEAPEGLHYVLSVRGEVRGVQRRGDRLAVGFEEAGLGSGQVQLFHRRMGASFEPEGLEIAVGMDRWSGFDLSPDGLRLVANLPGGNGVGVWSAEDGRLLASWPAERLARVLCFIDNERVLFDAGPALKIRDAAYAHPGNRLLVARVGVSGEITVIAGNFAAVLSAARWPSLSRMAFSDMEGLVRVVELGSEPRLAMIFAPKERGIPWQVRPGGNGLWVLLKGEKARVERFGLD